MPARPVTGLLSVGNGHLPEAPGSNEGMGRFVCLQGRLFWMTMSLSASRLSFTLARSSISCSHDQISPRGSPAVQAMKLIPKPNSTNRRRMVPALKAPRVLCGHIRQGFRLLSGALESRGFGGPGSGGLSSSLTSRLPAPAACRSRSSDPRGCVAGPCGHQSDCQGRVHELRVGSQPGRYPVRRG